MTALTVQAWEVIAGDVLTEFAGEPHVDQVLWDGACLFWLYANRGEIVARVPEGARVVVERHSGIHLDDCPPHGIPRPLHLVERQPR